MPVAAMKGTCGDFQGCEHLQGSMGFIGVVETPDNLSIAGF